MQSLRAEIDAGAETRGGKKADEQSVGSVELKGCGSLFNFKV